MSISTFFKNMFGANGLPENVKQFNKTQDLLAAQFAATEPLKHSFQKVQSEVGEANENLNDFININSNLPIAEDTVENRVMENRLRNRKWFTVAADALVSIPATKLVLGETLGYSATTMVALFLGSFISFALLRLAIDYNNDDKQNESSSLNAIWKKYSYLIPLMLIPALSLFLLYQNGGDSSSIIWLVFLLISFLLNLKAASYSKQYAMMENTVMARKERNGLEKKLNNITTSLTKIGDQMTKHREKIEVTATKLLRQWQQFSDEEKPKVYLSPRYVYVLNNRIYYAQVLPFAYELSIVEDTGPVGEYDRFWKNTSGVLQNVNTMPLETTAQPIINSPINDAQPVQSEPITQATNAEVDDAPSFGQTITDNQKFV